MVTWTQQKRAIKATPCQLKQEEEERWEGLELNKDFKSMIGNSEG